MKKFLLSLSAFALVVSASAQTTLPANDAKDIEGTYVAAVGTTGEHYQPLNSLTIGDYSFTFKAGETAAASQSPAYYTGTSATVRLYLGSNITISNSSVDFSEVKINLGKASQGIDSDKLSTSEGTVSLSSDKKTITWTRPETEQIINSVSVTLPNEKGSDAKNPNIQITSFTVTTVGGSVEPPVVKEPVNVASIAELYTKGTEDNTQLFNTTFPMTVTYVNGLNCFVTDGTTASLLYGNTTYAAGDIIPAGAVVTYVLYSGLPELKPADGYTLPVASGKTEVTYPAVELAAVTDADLNRIITIPSVTFAEDTPAAKANFTGTCGDASATFRNNFLLPAQYAGEYEVVVAVGCYNAAIQLQPISYKAINVVTPPEPTTGITIYNGLIENADDFAFVNDLIPEGVSYVWAWANANYGIKASAYVSGVRHTTKAWAISPVIDLTNYSNVKASFEQCANHYNDQATFTAMSSMWIRVADDEWEDLNVANLPDGKSWTFVPTGDIDLKDYDGKKIQFGFYYTSSQENDIAGTWEIKNLLVKGDKSTNAISVVENETLPVFFNLQGQRIENPSKGIFIKRCGGKSEKVIVK